MMVYAWRAATIVNRVQRGNFCNYSISKKLVYLYPTYFYLEILFIQLFWGLLLQLVLALLLKLVCIFLLQLV